MEPKNFASYIEAHKEELIAMGIDVQDEEAVAKKVAELIFENAFGKKPGDDVTLAGMW